MIKYERLPPSGTTANCYFMFMSLGGAFKITVILFVGQNRYRTKRMFCILVCAINLKSEWAEIYRIYITNLTTAV